MEVETQLKYLYLSCVDFIVIDSHAHLDLLKNLDEKIHNAKTEGVEAVFSAASHLTSNQKILNICEKYKGFAFPILGLDPSYCVREPKNIDKVPFEKGIAIGEIGLDFYWFKKENEKKLQRKLFEYQLEKAEELKKPVAIHAREAMSECLDILESYKLSTVMHCFSGTEKEMERSLDKDYWISFSTKACYTKAIQNLINKCSLMKMLVETDSPYLHPERKGKNEPANVTEVVKLIAKLKNTTFEKVCKQTKENTLKAFDLVI